jgi:flavin-dependent dehydrogenase
LTVSIGNGNGVRHAVRTRTLVGADGAFSSVACSLGFPRQPTAPLIQAVIRVPEEVPVDTARVWFAPDDTPYFYWLVPESPTRAVLGLIGEDGRRTRQCLERFLALHGWQAIEFQAARIPIYSKWLPVSRRIGQARVYLVGDAAGHVKVTTVGGIVTGFGGALGVADAIMKGPSTWLGAGRGRRLRALRRELNLHLWVRRAMHRFTPTDYDLLIDVLNAPAKRILARYTRDEPIRLLLSVCLCQPRLLLLACRALFNVRRVTSVFRVSPQHSS